MVRPRICTQVRHIAAGLARALGHLHENDRIHADLKPLNAVRIDGSWRLIDLDISCAVGRAFGAKVPTSGYCPPEMAKVLLDATNAATGDVRVAELQKYARASVAYDLWSFGVLLFELVFGHPLWHMDPAGGIATRDDLEKLTNWDRRAFNRAFKNARCADTPDARTAKALLCKLLEPDAAKRVDHFEQGVEMSSVLEEPFFQADLSTETIDELAQRAKRIEEKVDVIDIKLDDALRSLAAQFQMLSTILKGVDELAPKLICFLPAEALQGGKKPGQRWWHKALSPRSWFDETVLVFFFDPIRLRLANTNKGKGFEVKFTKAWVVKLMPYVKVSLATLKLAYVAGRLAGFPVPDVAGVVGRWIDEQLGQLDDFRAEAVDYLAKQTGDHELALKELDKLGDKVREVLAGNLEDIAELQEPLDAKVAEPLVKSVEELDKLLGPGWTKKTGLEMATCTKDGRTEWVLPEDVAEFKREGAQMLSKAEALKKRAPTDENKQAHERAKEEIKRRLDHKLVDGQVMKGPTPAKSSACVVS